MDSPSERIEKIPNHQGEKFNELPGAVLAWAETVTGMRQAIYKGVTGSPPFRYGRERRRYANPERDGTMLRGWYVYSRGLVGGHDDHSDGGCSAELTYPDGLAKLRGAEFGARCPETTQRYPGRITETWAVPVIVGSQRVARP